MSRGIFETLLGALVLIVAITFAGKLFLANDTPAIDTYTLSMRFGSAQGLKESSNVRLGGVIIGKVADIRLDDSTLEAIVEVSIDRQIKIPMDSAAEIATAGLLGNNFLKIVAGKAEKRIAEGGEITITHDPQSLEDLLGKAIFALSEE